MRAASGLLLLALGCTPGAATEPSQAVCAEDDLERCLSSPGSDALVESVDSFLGWAATRPEDVLAVAGTVTQRHAARLEREPWLHADWLELEARAQRTLAKPSREASLLERAYRLAPGGVSLTWLGGSRGEASHSVSLRPDADRLLPLLRALATVGEQDAARSLLRSAWARGFVRSAEDLPRGLADGSGSARSEPRALLGWPWRERIPELTIPLLGGGSFRTSEARGNVLILNLWASWCIPCVQELPGLEALYREHASGGLQVLAVNFLEPPDFAYAFVDSLGLSLPLGSCTNELIRALDVDGVPMALVVDRQGTIRARWSGYEEGVDEDIRVLTEELLAEAVEPPERLAQVSAGDERLAFAWMRRSSKPIEGVVFVPGTDGQSARVAATLPRSVDLFSPDGHVAQRVRTPAVVGRLVADSTGQTLYSFRPGSPRITRIDLADGEHEQLDTPSPVFDLAVGPDGPARVAAATLAGVYQRDGRDGVWTRVSERAPASSVRFLADGRLLALAGSQAGRWSADLETLRWSRVPPDSWSLVSTGKGDGFGVVPFTVTAVAQGRFFAEASATQIALALDGGELIVIDPGRPDQELWRSQWPEIRDLAAGDLDGDGLAELIVAAGKSLVVLRPVGESSSQDSTTALSDPPDADSAPRPNRDF